jgi:hypothetical protein
VPNGGQAIAAGPWVTLQGAHRYPQANPGGRPAILGDDHCNTPVNGRPRRAPHAPRQAVAIARCSLAYGRADAPGETEIEASRPPEHPGDTTHAGCTPWRRAAWVSPIERAGGSRKDTALGC